MAKIVIDARELRSSTGRYIERLLHYLQKIDTANSYIVLLKPADFETWQPLAPNFKKIVCKYKKFSFGEQLFYGNFLRKLHPDLVHFTMTQQPIIYFGRSVTTFHDLTGVRFKNTDKSPMLYWLLLPAYWLVIQVAARKNKLLITPTKYVKKDVAAFTKINDDKIVVTPEAADEFKDQAAQVEGLVGKSFLLYVGRPQAHKNIGRLIKAFGALKKKHPTLKLVLAGKKDVIYDEHLAAATSLGIADDIVFTGFVSDGQLRWLYQNCQAYVFPSLSEGFGLPGLEAMLHGAPVVSSNATCLPEVYGDAAEYFDPINILEMTKKIDLVLSDSDLRKKLVAKGYRRAKQYSWHRMAEHTLEVYEEALGA
jgi:glycosyltransferase involved in cell wall biosynthesis